MVHRGYLSQRITFSCHHREPRITSLKAIVTGYDQGVIPTEFAQVERLEKPVQLRRLVDAVARILALDV
jgi:hypothetical protein